MNIYDYIDNYGIYSFKEKRFNEVDSVIFSFLSYVNYSNILDKKEKKTIHEIGRMHLGLHNETERNIIATTEANKLLKYLKDSKRYKNCIIYNYEYKTDEDYQFGAITIEYEKNQIYISYEGTDQQVSGWKENLKLSYEFPTKAQELAIKYLKKYLFSIKTIRIGGHSKGGNLALIAGMYAPKIMMHKIITMDSMDGPGILEKEFKSKRYQKILPKFTHYIPEYCLVGLILNHSNDKVVAAKNKGILTHNIAYWSIENNHLKKGKLSKISENLDQEISDWLHKYSENEKKEFVENLDNIIKRCDIETILEIETEHKKIRKIIYESKGISTKNKEIMLDIINRILKCISKSKKEEWKELIHNFLPNKNNE